MSTTDARGELSRLGVEIDLMDRRSPEEVLVFIQALATKNSLGGITSVEVPVKSSIIELNE